MKVTNKRPSYIKSSDRAKNINQAYTIVFCAINKLDTYGNVIVDIGEKSTK